MARYSREECERLSRELWLSGAEQTRIRQVARHRAFLRLRNRFEPEWQELYTQEYARELARVLIHAAGLPAVNGQPPPSN
jgi:hypothetical protein